MGFRDERLWEILNEKAEKEDQGLRPDQQIKEQYLSAVEVICQYGVDRARTIRDTFPMYTLHDEIHICNVMRLMERLLGDKAEKLSRDEAALLILCACCHDIGMSYSEEDKKELFGDADRLNHYLDTHQEEYVKAYRLGEGMPQMTEDMIQDYLRSIHHERIREIMCGIEWPRVLDGRIRREDIIRVCQSHGENCELLEKLEPTPHVDLRFCGILLRLADILDFDTSRAPEAVYEYSGFGHVQSASGIKSKEEWQKHISSNGFDFTCVTDRSFPYSLNYSATCKTMQVEQVINCYLDWIDKELIDCNNILQKFTGRWRAFILPGKIIRNITSEGYVSGQYRLTLDQDQVLQLFTGENLYDDPTVFVRELIQNAIDAVRTRKQLDKNLPENWEGKINIRCWMDEEGYHWFRIEDNGIGMTEDIIQNYFLKVGKSYYNSDEFMQAKLRCRADLDYTPISQFGIGILSCFMGDKKNKRVEVSTKHFNEGGIYYPALRLSMHGINGYFYLANKNDGHQPGAMVGITEREKKPYLNEAGTVIAVRTNLYWGNTYKSFKDIVDKYVFFPEVHLHYEDEEQAFDYNTEQEFMDEVYSFQPSDTLEKSGLLEIAISEDDFQMFCSKIPELVQIKRPLPKMLLKCVVLDEYTKSPYLKGVILLGKKAYDWGWVEVDIDGQKERCNIWAIIKTIAEGKVTLIIELSIKKHTVKHEFILKMNVGNYGKWIEKLEGNIDPFNASNLIVHNGVLCTRIMDDTHCSGSVRGLEKISALFLLKDRYRPITNISRDKRSIFDLETECELSIIERKFNREYGLYLLDQYDTKKMLPVGRYWKMLEMHLDWASEVNDSVEKMIKNIDEHNENSENVCKIETSQFNVRLYDMFKYHMGFTAIYNQIFSAYLRMNYDVKIDFYSQKYMYISRLKRSLPKEYGDYFPAFLFVPPLYNDQKYLTIRWHELRFACNETHRLSQFMLKYAKKLNEKAPGIFRSMIRILLMSNDDDLIHKMNTQLKILHKLPGNPFEITEGLYLTKDDLSLQGMDYSDYRRI